MKYLLKISLLLCGVFCFILACEQKEPAKADLTSYDEIFGDQDTMYSGDVGPAALRVIFGEKRFWRLSDSTFALMSQDTSNMQETIVREDSIFAWFMTKLPDSLNLASYSDTLRVSNDTLYISGQETGFYIGGAGGGGGASLISYTYKSATYTTTANDEFIEATANSFTINLPTAVGITGKAYTVKNTGAGTITLDPDGTETIDGASTKSITVQYEAITVMSNGTNWLIK